MGPDMGSDGQSNFACLYCQGSAERVTVLKLYENKALVVNEAHQQYEVLTDLLAQVAVNDILWVDSGVALGQVS